MRVPKLCILAVALGLVAASSDKATFRSQQPRASVTGARRSDFIAEGGAGDQNGKIEAPLGFDAVRKTERELKAVDSEHSKNKQIEK